MNTSQHGQYQTYPQPLRPPGYPEAKIPYLRGGPVGFGEAIRQAHRNRFTYRGRASRTAYWLYSLFGGIIIVACYVIFAVVLIASGAGRSAGSGQAHATAAGPLTFLAVLLVLLVLLWFFGLPQLALSVRRLHDIGQPGWWLLLGLVPFGSIILLVFHCMEGTPGPNRYDLGDG
ncbi:MAG TPA: DUF805 domain-containing protein [Streptosporangiaceae bacterium]|nr:DUF805 domain-containing protein [Streptosporangiaceae bacterium]